LSGGAYIPPGKLKLLLRESLARDKQSIEYQRLAWEALKKSIHGLVNKVNIPNIGLVVRQLFKENIVRGRGLLCRSLMQAQLFSPSFTNVYASLIAIVNMKFPQIGELLLRRLIAQFKSTYKQNKKDQCLATCKFIGHLINQNVAHEILSLQILTLLLENPTNHSVEVAIGLLKDVGKKLTLESPRSLHAIFETLRSILNEKSDLVDDKRIQYMIEAEKALDSNQIIIDETETNLVALRRTIYLTIQSSLDFQECAHKLLRMQLKPQQQAELCQMILDACAQQRTYERFFGLLAQRFCQLKSQFVECYELIFRQQYETCHRLETVKLRNVSRMLSHLLYTDSISWGVFECVRLNEQETTSSSRVYLKNLLLDLSEHMGLAKTRQRFGDVTLGQFFTGLFPTDNPRNTRFSINFFTSIGLGALTEDLREHLKNAPKPLLVLPPPPSDEHADAVESKSKSKSKSKKKRSDSPPSHTAASSTSSSDQEEDAAETKRRKDKRKKSKRDSSHHRCETEESRSQLKKHRH
jgi:pre-mRNA-splicing factor CWC22